MSYVIQLDLYSNAFSSDSILVLHNTYFIGQTSIMKCMDTLQFRTEGGNC